MLFKSNQNFDVQNIKKLRNYPALRSACQISRSEDVDIYLVGGTLRDAVTGVFKGVDFDFVVSSRFEYIVKCFSEKVSGKTIEWDCNQTRVVFYEKGACISADFALLKGNNIVDDLSIRDFTINSLAINLKNLFDDDIPVLLDPTGGLIDIKERVVRAANSAVFSSDPLRILRAIRFARIFDFPLDRETLAEMCSKSRLLGRVAVERIKREIFTVLGLPSASQSLDDLLQTGALAEIVPEVKSLSSVEQSYPHRFNLHEHSLQTVRMLEQILGDETGVLKNHHARIEDYLGCEIEQGVSRKSLLVFAAFFHDTGKTVTAGTKNSRNTFYAHDYHGGRINRIISHRLGLGRQGRNMIVKITENHMRILQLSLLENLTERAKIRFLMDMDGVELEVILLAAADVLSTGTDKRYMQTVDRVLDLCVELIDRIYNPDSNKKKIQLVTGDDIIQILKISEGRQVGLLLRKVWDLERSGTLKTRDDAIKWLKAGKGLH